MRPQGLLVDYAGTLVKELATWKQFFSSQIHSLYAMDFFTVDTIVKQRFYVFFIIYYVTREIVQFAITRNLI